MDSSAPDRPPLRQQRWPWLVLLMLCAALYYGSYYRHGINFRDEGGTLTLGGQRLLAGELPFRDINLGYNVGWFTPIVALFKITGVNFVALRVFFMALCALTGAFTFLTVELAARYTGRARLAAPLAFLVGLGVLLVPGMIFKNYNPLAAVANGWCLLAFILAGEVREANWRALVGGGVLGATWLVRIDVGTLCTLLWLGVLLARLPGPRAQWRARAASSAMALGILLGSTALLHVPFFLDAHHRGFAPSFLAAYPNHWKLLGSKLAGLTGKAESPAKPAETSPAPPPLVPAVLPDPAPAAGPTKAASPAKTAAGAWKDGTQSRSTWATVSQASEKNWWKELGLFLLTYLPLLSLIPMAVWAFVFWLRTIRTGGDPRPPLAALALLGSALALFPQFFFWRPDSPHLSEFGPGYWTGTVGALLMLTTAKSWRRLPVLLLIVFLVLLSGVWFCRMFTDRWCGSIAARWNRKVLVEGDNGVRVYEQKDDAPWIKDMVDLIHAHSDPGEYLVAFPYHPAFNVIANRPTYVANVYMDNAEVKPSWSGDTIAEIEKRRPAIVIISDWAINNTDASRFRHWAAPVCDYVRDHYELLGSFDNHEYTLYARPGSHATAPPPSRTPVDDALSYALEAAQRYVAEGFTVRDDYWGGDMAVKQAKAITHQLFKGNEYWFWMGTEEKTAKVSIHIYDSDGNLCEAEYHQKGQTAMARVLPKRTGSYYLIVEIESSTKERTHWGMAYGFK